MNKSFKVFLTFSVIINLLLVGVIVGSFGRNIMDMPPHHMPPPPPDMVKSWPADKRAAFGQAMDKVNNDTAGLRDELHDAHKKLGDIIKADTFDKAAYLQQMQRIHELHARLADHMAQAIADLASQWNPQDRVLLADVVRGPMMLPPGHGRGDAPPPPPPGDEPPPPPSN